MALDFPSSPTLNQTYTFNGRTWIWNGAGWAVQSATVTSIVSSGTVMLFQQTAAPTGWTKITTHNDKALRVVSGTVSSGGTTAFSSVFNGSVGATTLTTAQIPSHTHNYTTYNVLNDLVNTNSNSLSFWKATSTTSSGSAGSGGSHTHSIDVQYVDVIFASKD